MNKKKVDLLLINPPFHRRNGSGSIFPLGLGYIIAAAKKEGYTCDVINGYSMIDSYANESLSDFEIKLQNLLETYDPVLVGIGPCITTQLRALQIIARCCLTIYGDDRVYAGGPLASIDGQEWLFFELLRIRYIVKGDGEEAICQMLFMMLVSIKEIHIRNFCAMSSVPRLIDILEAFGEKEQRRKENGLQITSLNNICIILVLMITYPWQSVSTRFIMCLD